MINGNRIVANRNKFRSTIINCPGNGNRKIGENIMANKREPYSKLIDMVFDFVLEAKKELKEAAEG